MKPDRMHPKISLTFDDVCLIDGLSTLPSRSQVSLTTTYPKGWSTTLPVMSAAMDTITSGPMAKALLDSGGAIFHHRNQPSSQRAALLVENQKHPNVLTKKALNGVAVGLDETAEDIEHYIKSGASLIGLEVAHAYHTDILRAVREFGEVCREADVLFMVGNFSSTSALTWLAHEVGDLVDIVKVSQGGGSACTTRLVTGIGKPTWQAVYDACQKEYPFKVVADGGIRRSGDLAKALGAGACCGMLGGMLSGTDEAPGEIIEQDGKRFKAFRGMASKEAKLAVEHSGRNVEGISTLVPYKGPVRDILNQVRDGLQSSIASCGFADLEEFRQEVRFRQVSQASQIEAQPHSQWL